MCVCAHVVVHVCVFVYAHVLVVCVCAHAVVHMCIVCVVCNVCVRCIRKYSLRLLHFYRKDPKVGCEVLQSAYKKCDLSPPGSCILVRIYTVTFVMAI